ncbi:MAG TPA: TonB-dependent receptor [Bryobacteraceae bacterium]|nr:TonB-dependent receptor [Bryobacteraceae bacterium]
MKREYFAVGAFLLLFSVSAFGQTGTEGSILGTIVDSTGAAVPSASVTVTNTDTGVAAKAASNADGYFQVLALQRGTYSVTVEKTGFNTWQVRGIDLTAQENKRLSPVLSVGTTQQEVTVTAGVDLVRTEDSSMTGAVEQKQIRELPLNGRDSIQMVELVPGMRYLGEGGNTDARTVQGLGIRTDQTLFTVDGQDHNDPSTENGIIIPNLDSVAQFRVETANFTAASGRQPLQVKLITKGGTNEFHGTLFEFLRNDALDARNTFALTRPKLRQNQFGGSLGGPIKKDNTFFFASFEDTRIRTEQLFNSFAISPALLAGNFGSTRVTDPLNGQPFPNNQIPANRFSGASKFFLPYFLQPNTSDGDRYVAQAPIPDDATNFFMRIDHQISPTKRIYGRWTRVQHDSTSLGYQPDIDINQSIAQHSIGLSFDWTITPRMVLSLGSEFSHSTTTANSPVVGKENLNQEAGLQGFPSSLMENTIGLPTVAITAYSGFSYPQQVPSSFKRELFGEIATLNVILSRHTIVLGAEYSDRRTTTHHASSSPRGTFNFNGQYTGNSFADYLLGYVQSTSRNFPLGDFGVAHSPYEAFYVQDDFRASRRLTLNLGVRFDHWNEKQFVRGCGATFDQALGKVLAGENPDGQVDLTCQPVGPFLGPATASLWIPASQAGVPRGLFEPSGFLSPRLGFAWRPTDKNDFVVRGAWGIFTSSYQGNYTGSSIIGPPYWLSENISFAKASLQSWETAYPAEPHNFVAPSVVNAAYNVKPNVVEQWNFSIQKAIPFLQSALTLSYVGNRGYHLVTKNSLNEVPPGTYTNLQASKPYPGLGNVFVYNNTGNSTYNSLVAVLERRFRNGLSYSLNWTFARALDDFQSLLGGTQQTPFAPAGYNYGPSALERRHIVSFNGIYELPFGKGKRWGTNLSKLAGGLLGGWEISTIYQFTSGQPLVFTVPGTTLGNGYNTRPNLLADPHLDNPSVSRWFNPNYVDASGACQILLANEPCALGVPARTFFGNAGIGIVSGPAIHTLDAALMKNFHFRERDYVQFRWEAFNAFNEVNLGNPVLNITQANTGTITSTQADARVMQIALKVIF